MPVMGGKQTLRPPSKTCRVCAKLRQGPEGRCAEQECVNISFGD